MGRYRRRSDNYFLGQLIKGIFYLSILPIILVVYLIKFIVNKKSNKSTHDEINVIEEESRENIMLINNQDNNQLQSDINTLRKKKRKINAIHSICGFFLALLIIFTIGNIGNTTPFIIGLILTILLAVPTYIYNEKLKEITIELNHQEQEEAYQIHREKMKIENEKFEQYKKEHQFEEETPKSKYHIKTKTITDNEKYFLDIIKKHFGKDYDIRVQVPLSNIIEKEKEYEREYQNELNRIIDIGIFNKDTSYPLLLIEINDSTHKRKDRQIRDAKVKNICEQAGIKLIAFWTEYSNTEEYIVNRVNTNLRDSN